MKYTVRRVMPLEYFKYRAHLKGMDTASKTLRFGGLVNDEIIDKLCDSFEADTGHHVLFCIEDDDLNFIAIGHVATIDGMELAFSVHKQYQGQGMGNALMCRCIQYCRITGILTGCMTCLAHNHVIKHLCIKHGVGIHTEYGETQATITLDQAGIDTFISEGIEGNLSMFDYVYKRSNIIWTYMLR